MKSMKLMLPALLLSLSLGAFAQDDDELLNATSEDEAEVFVPSYPWEKPIYHRVQLGYSGTFAKYTNNNPKSTILGNESHYLSGISLGWISDIVLTKNRNIPLYIELGGLLTYQTGHYDGTNRASATVNYKWHSRVYGFSLTIPVNLTYQFRNFKGVDGLTLAPFVGLYGRFNFVADRRLKKTTEFYHTDINGNEVLVDTEQKVETKSLMKGDREGGWATEKPHAGRLLQIGTQLGVNAYYKRFSFGLQYMIDLMPFAQHSSDQGVSKKENSVDGYTVTAGTGCDMEMTTRHNFAITVGYIF